MKEFFQKIKESKGFLIPLIILIVAIVVFGGGITYAYFQFIIDTENVSSLKVMGTNFDIKVVSDEVNISNAYPILDSERIESANLFPFSVKNDSRKVNACYNIYMIVEDISDELISEYFKWELVNLGTNETVSGNFSNLDPDDFNNKMLLLSNSNIFKGSATNYYLRIWMSYSLSEDQMSMLGTYLRAKISVEAESEYCGETSVAYFPATGEEQVFLAQEDGEYRVELWGAGYSTNKYGSYTKGTITLTEGDILHVYVGNKDGYNLGATDVRLTYGEYNDSASLNSRIMVASGASSSYNGGGLSGYGSSNQVSGTFGPGAYRTDSSGGSGASYISGHSGSVSITSSSSNTPKSGCSQGTTTSTCIRHYSGKYFTDTVMIDGAGYKWTTTKGSITSMPKYNEVGYFASGTGNNLDGYAKITLLD